jgi:hypothetical protein
MTAEELTALLSPYQQAMAGAISGTINETPDAIDRFTKLQPAYLPLVKFITFEAAYAQECNTLKIGFGADVAKLMTPMDTRLFSTERYVSYATAMWRSAQLDPDASAAVSDALNRRITRELRLNSKGTSTAYVPLRRPSEGAAPATR